MLFLLLELSESIAPLVLLVRWHEPYPHTESNRTEPWLQNREQNRTVPLVYRYTPNTHLHFVVSNEIMRQKVVFS